MVALTVLITIMSTLLLQWNMRGLNQNYTSGLKPLIDDLDPLVITIQETKLKNSYQINKYKEYEHINKNNEIAAGGTSIYVKQNILHKPLKLNTELQAQAVRITTHRPITVCSIYIPQSHKLTLQQLEDLQDQLPRPFIITGDFNAHSPLWGEEQALDARGKILEGLLAKSNTHLLNDGSPTYLIPSTLKTTSVDLSLCSPELAPSLTWSTLDDTWFSDHYPITINSVSPEHTTPPPYFNFKKANWFAFTQECKSLLNTNTENKTIEHFTDKLLEIADRNIPKLSTHPRKNKSWFNNDCSQAVKHKKHMLRKAKANNTHENITNFKIAQAKCRQVCRNAKKTSFEKFISKINHKTPMTKIWKMIKKLKGTYKETVKHITKEDGSTAETETEVANEIAKTIEKNSSSENYNNTFKKIKTKTEKGKTDFSTNTNETYNKKFTKSEISNILHKLNQTASGPDRIHNTILTHLPEETITLLLEIFNTIWEEKYFPDSWRKATIIPIPKPGKDHTNPSNYRPIALTSCLCKLMEKLVNNRLMWYLESNKKLSKLQSGYRKNRSTLDQLIRLETIIRNAFLKGEHVTVVFFDIEKAFDTTWKAGILQDLHNMGLRGNLPNFIDNFLQHRQFQIKIGSALSDWHSQEEGVPQGSILSPILFEIKINSIIETVSPDTNSSLYVDDFLIAYTSKSKIDCTERHLQQQLNKIETWANQNGYKFSTSKTQVVHFCKRNKCIKTPELTLYKQKIPVKNEAKFLGVIFDKKLTFLPHIKDLKLKCQNALNAFKILCSPEWGGDTNTLLQLYNSLIRSKLDYACQIYGSAKPSYLKMLNPIQNQGLRLATGAFRTSPETSLHVETNTLPLELRRKQLTLQYAIKIGSTPQNPVFNCLFETPELITQKTKKNKTAIKPIGLRIKADLRKINFQPQNLIAYKTPNPPLWELTEANIDLELTKFPKQTTTPLTYRENFYKILYEKYKNDKIIYTDGSKSDTAVGAAAVPMIDDLDEINARLPDVASIYTGEATALDMALSTINKAKETKFVICTDSLSCLKALKALDTPDPRILKLKIKIHELSIKNKSITLFWIPSHVGIEGNEMADEHAKNALEMEITNIKLPYTDYKPKIKQLVTTRWQKNWSEQTQNKLFEIQPKLQPNTHTQLKRKDSVIYTRLKIGHTSLTHKHILTRNDKPFCVGCNTDLTIKHILTNCTEFNTERKKHYRCTKIKDIFNIIEPTKILQFIKEINLYNKL